MEDSVLLAWPKRTKRSRLHRLGYFALLRAGNGWNSLRSNSIHFFSALRVAPLNAHPLNAGPFLLTSVCSCAKAGSFPSRWDLLFRTYRYFIRVLTLLADFGLFVLWDWSFFQLRAVPGFRIRTYFIPRLNFVTHLIFILTLWHFDILTQFGCEANSCFLIIACFWAMDSSLLLATTCSTGWELIYLNIC